MDIVKATMSQIAREVDVSVGVVSRLLRNDPTLRISEERRQQIMEVNERLGGVQPRKENKRALTQCILAPISRLFAGTPTMGYLTGMPRYRHFEQALKPRGFHLHYSFFDEGEDVSYFHDMMEPDAPCDGLLLLSGLINEEIAERLRSRRFPHIVDDHRASRLQVNTVAANSAEGIQQAVERLTALGHQRIAFVGEPQSTRYSLTVAALARHGLSLDEDRHCWLDRPPANQEPSAWRDCTARQFAEWLERQQPLPTAIVCQNDYTAFGAMDTMRERGLEPGIDLSIIGHDNIEVRGPKPATSRVLSTIDNPDDLIGVRMADLLVNQIQHSQTQIVQEQIPAAFIERVSIGPAPTS